MGKILKKGKIRYVVIGLILMVMAPVMILCTVGIGRNGRELQERNLEYWSLIAQDITYDMDKAISEYDSLSMFVLVQDRLLDILSKDSFDSYEYLEAYSWLRGQFPVDLYLKTSLVSSFQVIGNNGFFYTSDSDITLSAVEQMKQDIKKNGAITVFMPYASSGIKDRNRVTIARYIYSYKDLKPLGYFMIHLKPTELDQIWENKDLTNIRTLILDEEGNAIYGEAEDIGEYAWLKDHMTEKIGNFYGNNDGKKCFYVYQRSDYTGWTSVLEIPESLYREPFVNLIRLFLISGAFAVFLSSLLGFFIIRRIYETELGNQRMELSRNRAELKALQTQINPHFLYNTLGAINMYSVCEDSNAVQEITGALSDMFRYAVQNPMDPVKITDEIAHVKNYLKIQEYRLGTLPRIEINIEGLENVCMLWLTLQPIVENVFKHAFAGGVKPEHKIVIWAQRSGDKLLVDVVDNGRGPSMDVAPMEFVPDGETSGRGIGLSNVHRRLKLAYGEAYGLNISGVKGKGMTIRICQPLIFQNDGEDVHR